MENEIDKLNNQIRQLTSQNKRISYETIQLYLKLGEISLFREKKYQEAEDYILQAQDIIKLLSPIQQQQYQQQLLVNESKIFSLLGEISLINFNYSQAEEHYLNAIMKRLYYDQHDTIELFQLFQKLMEIFLKLNRSSSLIQQMKEACDLVQETLQNKNKNNKSDNNNEDNENITNYILLTLNEIAMSYATTENLLNFSKNIFEFLIKFCKLYLPFEDITTTRFMNNYAEILRNSRLFHESMKIHEEILLLRRDLLQRYPDSISPLFLAETCNNLGLVYRSLDLFDKAEELLLEALYIRKDQLNTNGLIASTLNNLAEVYRDKGVYAQAILYHETAITMYEKLFGLEHPTVINAKGNMGITIGHYSRIGHQLSHDLIKYSLTYLNKNSYDNNHPWIKKFQQEILLIKAEEYLQHEQYIKSINIFNQILLESRLPSTSDVIISLNKQRWMVQYTYAKSLYSSSQYIQAIDIFKECIDTHVNLYNPNESIMCQATFLQADNLRLAGDIVNSIQLFETLLKLRSNTIGNGHPLCAQLINGLGMCSLELEKFSEAKSYFLQAIGIMISAIKENFIDDLSDNQSNQLLLSLIYSNYSNLQLKLSFYSYSLQQINESLSLRQQYLEDNDLLISDSLLIKASINLEIGNFLNVENDLLNISIIYKEHYPIGKPHPRLLQLSILYVELYLQQKKFHLLSQSMTEMIKLCDLLYPDGSSTSGTSSGTGSSTSSGSSSGVHYLSIKVLYLQGCYQYINGNYRQVSKYLSKAILQSKKLYGQFSILGGKAAYLEGRTYSILGNLKQASTSYREAMAILEITLGITHPYYIQAVIGLAYNMCLMGSYPECEVQYHTIETLIKNRNELVSDTGRIEGYQPLEEYFEFLPVYLEYLLFLSNLFYQKGQYMKSKDIISLALQFIDKKYGHTSTTSVTTSGGPTPSGTLTPTPYYCDVMLYQLENKRVIGEELDTLLLQYEENINEKKKFYSSDHPSMIDSIVAYRSYCLDYFSDNQKILLLCRTELLDASLVVSRRYTTDSIMYATISCLLGRLYYISSDIHNSQKYYSEAMKIYEELFNGEHVLIAECLLYSSQVEKQLKNYETCEVMLEKSIEMFGSTLGYEHPKTIYAHGTLGLLWIQADHTLTPGLKNIKTSLEKLQKLNFSKNHCWILELKAGLDYVENHILASKDDQEDDLKDDKIPVIGLQPILSNENENDSSRYEDGPSYDDGQTHGDGHDGVDDENDAISLNSAEREIVNLELALDEKNEIISELSQKCAKYEELLGMIPTENIPLDRSTSPIGVASLDSSRRPSRRLEQKMFNDVKTELDLQRHENQKLLNELEESRRVISELQKETTVTSLAEAVTATTTPTPTTTAIDPIHEHSFISFAVEAVKKSLNSDATTEELKSNICALEAQVSQLQSENNDIKAQLDAALISLASIPQSLSPQSQENIPSTTTVTTRVPNPHIEAEVTEALSSLFASNTPLPSDSKPSNMNKIQADRLAFIQAQYQSEPGSEDLDPTPGTGTGPSTGQDSVNPDMDVLIGFSVDAMKKYLEADKLIQSLRLQLDHTQQELLQLQHNNSKLQPNSRNYENIPKEEEAFLSVSVHAMKGFVNTQDQIEVLQKELKELKIQYDAVLTSLASVPQPRSTVDSEPEPIPTNSSLLTLPRPKNPNLESEVSEAISLLFSLNSSSIIKIDDDQIHQMKLEYEKSLLEKDMMTQELTSSLHETEKRLEDLKSQLQLLETSHLQEISFLTSKMNSLQVGLREAEVSLDNARQSNTATTTDTTTTATPSSSDESKQNIDYIYDLENENNKYLQEISHLRRELEEISSEFDLAYMEKQNLLRSSRHSLQQETNELKGLQNEINKLKEENMNLLHELEKITREYHQSTQEIQQVTNQSIVLEEKVQEMELNLLNLNETLLLTQLNYQTETEKNQNLMNEIQDMTCLHKKLEVEVMSSHKEIVNLQKELKDLNLHNKELQEEYNQRGKELREWINENKYLENFLTEQRITTELLKKEIRNYQEEEKKMKEIISEQLENIRELISKECINNIINEINEKELNRKIEELSKEMEYHEGEGGGYPSPEDYIYIGTLIQIQRKKEMLEELKDDYSKKIIQLENLSNSQDVMIQNHTQLLRQQEENLNLFQKNYLELGYEMERICTSTCINRESDTSSDTNATSAVTDSGTSVPMILFNPSLQIQYLSYLHDLETLLHNKNTAIQDHENTIRNLQADLQDATTSYQELETHHHQYMKDSLFSIQDHENTIKRLQDELQDASKSYHELETHHHQYMKDSLSSIQDHENTIKRLQDELQDASKSYQDLETQHHRSIKDSLSSSLVNKTLLLSQNNELNRLLSQQISITRHQNELIEELRDGNHQKDETILRQENEITLLLKIQEENKLLIQNLNENIEKLINIQSNQHEKILEQEQRIQQLSGELEKLQDAKNILEGKYENLNNENNENKKIIMNLNQNIVNLNEEIHRYQEEIATLQEDIQEKAMMISNLSTIIIEKDLEINELKLLIQQLQEDIITWKTIHEQDLLQLNEMKQQNDELQVSLSEKERIILRFHEQRKLQDPWGFSREGGKRFVVVPATRTKSATGTSSSTSPTRENLYLETDDLSEYSSTYGTGYRGIKNLQHGLTGTSIPDDNSYSSIHEESSTLSNHIDELCLGSLPAKSFLIAAKSNYHPIDNSDEINTTSATSTSAVVAAVASSAGSSSSPTSKMFPKFDSSRELNLETDYIPTPAKAYRDKREPLKAFMNEDNDEKSNYDHHENENIPITVVRKQSSSRLPPPTKPSAEPTLEKIFFPRDPNKIKTKSMEHTDDRKIKSSDGSIGSRSHVTTNSPPHDSRPVTQHSKHHKNVKGKDQTNITNRNLSLKPVQSAPALFADEKSHRSKLHHEAADSSPSPVSGGTTSNPNIKRKSKIPIKSANRNKISHESSSNLGEDSMNSSFISLKQPSLSGGPPTYGCSVTEQDATNMKSRKNSKSYVEESDGLSIDTSHTKPRKFYPELDWDRRFQKSPYDSAIAPHHAPQIKSPLSSPVKPPPSQGMQVRQQFGLY